MNDAPIFIGIAGASASGKSLLAHTIHHELQFELGEGAISIIKEDSYYKARHDLTFEEREQINYDHPNAFDHDLLIEQMDALAGQRSVEVPVYDYKMHNRSDRTTTHVPTKVIIVEGILLLNDKNIRKRLDAKVFMDTDLDICLLRRLKRDIEERGRTVDSIIEQYKRTVRPMFMEFVQPSKQWADIIVPRGGKNRVVIEMLKARIKQMLE
ncbi:uridine kinase [Reinekea blandensis]|uniref:Uridine kinase n=1 Tax=Reinekea blandensis MED297 TaxID=314283 RepID=A4BAC0_9GAMM|nr:uridine kinase [Reinekea blandensis]EAR10876.1 uridine kinase [Reinekea sp. MED297] [Reinekea blandensis MED297]